MAQSISDQLFTDADRHGPRRNELIRRIVAALIALPVAVTLSVLAASKTAPEFLVIALTVLGIMACGWVLTPFSRLPALPLIASAVLLLSCVTILVYFGWIVIASVPAVWGALFLGFVAARSLFRAVWVVPVLFVAGLSDAQSVRSGVTHDLLSTNQLGDDPFGGAEAAPQIAGELITTIAQTELRVIDFFVLHIPTGPSALWILGLVDVIAIGLLLGLTHLYWQPIFRTVIALTAALLLVAYVGSVMPVLPVLGAAWIAANARLVWRSTRFTLRRITYLGG